jgi:hypothetical protein
MGPGRGGACTYDWIERRMGIDIHNTDRIIPEFQSLKVGDEIPMPGYTMRGERLDPARAMVFRSSNHAWISTAAMAVTRHRGQLPASAQRRRATA